LEALELQLQHLTPERKARHPDALHDLLIRLGDLTDEEIFARCETPAGAGSTGSRLAAEPAPAGVSQWISQLEGERRVVRLPIGGETRYIAAEDTGRYRDALGIPPPPGLPAAFLEFVRDPLGELLARYART